MQNFFQTSKEKGISPLIAVVLLIGLTVAVGGLISLWLIPFTKERTETLTREAELDIICARAGISFREMKYCNPRLSGKITNVGAVSLGSIKMEIIFANASKESIPLCLSDNNVVRCASANLTILPREIFGFNFSIGGSNYETIRIITNCTGTYDEVRASDISVIC